MSTKQTIALCSGKVCFTFPKASIGVRYAKIEIPLITSNIRGPADFMEDGITGYLVNPYDVNSFAAAIRKLKENSTLRLEMGNYNKGAVRPFLLNNSKKEVLNLVSEILDL